MTLENTVLDANSRDPENTVLDGVPSHSKRKPSRTPSSTPEALTRACKRLEDLILNRWGRTPTEHTPVIALNALNTVQELRLSLECDPEHLHRTAPITVPDGVPEHLHLSIAAAVIGFTPQSVRGFVRRGVLPTVQGRARAWHQVNAQDLAAFAQSAGIVCHWERAL